RRSQHLVPYPSHHGIVPITPDAREPFRLPRRERTVVRLLDPGRPLLRTVRVHPHDDPFTALDRELVLVRGPMDLLLDVRDRPGRAAELLDPAEVRSCLLLQRVRQRLDVVAPAERVDRLGYPRLGRQDLLRPEREASRLL